MLTRFPLVLAMTAACALATTPAQAAIVQTTAAAPTTQTDLTAEGGLDWAFYTYDSGLTTESMNGGTGIGPLQLIGNRSASSFSYPGDFAWSDGTATTSATGQTGGAADNTWGGNILQLTADADAAPRDLVLYLMRLNATIRVDAELSNGDPLDSYTYSSTGYNTEYDRHVIRYSSATPATLTVTIVGAEAPQNVTPTAGLAAATLSVVPEPASLALLAAGGLCLLRRRPKSALGGLPRRRR
jgi:hypothetical protein